MSSASPHTALDQLAELRQQFQSCSAAAQELLVSALEGELTKRPVNQGWSVAECIQHLTATTQLYLPILESALQNAPAGSRPFQMDWRGRLLKWILEPPYRSRVKTLPSLEPQIADVKRVLPDFLASQESLFESMKPWSDRALDRVIIASPFNKRLRYNVYSLFNVVAAHQRRHLWQAQRVKDQIKGK
jgi:DinB superfamily